jgi:GAF domain-containing protein
VAAIEDVLQGLLASTGASRATLRQDVSGDYHLPVTHEALSPGVGSLMEERTIDLRTQPVARAVAGGNQVVQDDCAAASDDPEFHRMREAYGGLGAQIVTPVQRGDRVAAVLSLHQLGSPRHWTDAEAGACRAAAAHVAELL